MSQKKDLSNNSANEYKYQMLYPGDTIREKYQIIQELGSGGFATTYLAIDTLSENNSKCVIKQLQPKFNSPSIWQNAKERLEKERSVLLKLGKHEQIPQLLDYFEEKAQFYLILEFIDGEDFTQEVQKKLLNEVEVIHFLQEVLEILYFVHQQGVIHRDIKPSNLIRRNRDRKITLIDFGAVKEMGTTILQSSFRSSRDTLHTQIIGTPGYMAPEQNNGKPVFSSDIYALGKTAIYALTGHSPTEWEQIEIDEAIFWQDKVNISQGLIQVLLRMISPKTSERFTSVSQVIAALKPLFMIGQVLQDRYSIVGYLHSEGVIDNYIVRDNKSQEDASYFATKINHISTAQEAKIDSQRQIQSFIEKIKKIDSSPQILSITDYFIDRDGYYLIQEYVSGKTIDQLIKKNVIFSESRIIKLITTAATAINVCHQQKIVHGNIQPSSLIISQDQEKIILRDFNIFEKINNSFSAMSIDDNAIEKNEIRLSYNHDIYSLGMTAIYALTGKIPQKIARNPHTGKILWTKDLKINENLIALINKMISLDRHQRYQSISQVIRDVKKTQSRSRFPFWYLYILSIPLLLIGILLIVAQWSQRTAILEFYKADIMLEGEQYNMAIDYYDAGLNKIFKTKKQVKHFQQVWLKKATAFNRLDKYQAALETCDEALKYYQSYQLWNCKGLALDSLEKYPEAILAYNEAIAIKEDYLWLWNNRGEVYTKLGQVKKAISDFQTAISLNQEQSFVPWNNLGKLYYQQQQYQQSIITYQQALLVKQDYVPALIGLGNCYKAQKNYALALETYNQVIQIDDHAYEAWFGKGLVEESLQRYTAAATTYQQALNIREEGEDGDVVQQALQRVLQQLRVEN